MGFVVSLQKKTENSELNRLHAEARKTNTV